MTVQELIAQMRANSRLYNQKRNVFEQTTYPELYFSIELDKILRSIPPLPEPPQPPAQPTEPKDPGDFNMTSGCLLYSIFAIGVVIYIWGISEGMPDEVIFPGALLLFILFVFALGSSKSKKQHKQDIKDYKLAKSNFQNALKNYQNLQDQYINNKKAYDIKISNLHSESNIKSYREKSVKNWKIARCKPLFDNCTVSDKVKKGASEDFFKKILEQEFTVYTNKKVPAGDSFYYPDIILVHDNLYLDIEIDEPYEIEEGVPIHYLEDKFGSTESVDKYRNIFMTKFGWEVIRFAEEQIYLHPEECLKYIKEIIDSVSKGEISSPDILPIINKWTKDQSHKMAYSQYRKSYLFSQI